MSKVRKRRESARYIGLFLLERLGCTTCVGLKGYEGCTVRGSRNLARYLIDAFSRRICANHRYVAVDPAYRRRLSLGPVFVGRRGFEYTSQPQDQHRASSGQSYMVL